MDVKDLAIIVLSLVTVYALGDSYMNWRLANKMQKGWENSLKQREADLKEFQAFQKQVRYLSKEFGIPEIEETE